MKNKKKLVVHNKLFEGMALKSKIDLKVINSKDYPCFKSQYYQDPVQNPNPTEK